MAWCHGSGPGAGEHCCWVNGAPCPHLMDNAATVAWINSQGWGATKRNAALTMAQNITWLCRIALQVMADDQSTQNNRAKFENAWNTHPDYVAFPRPVWAQLETDSRLAGRVVPVLEVGVRRRRATDAAVLFR